MFLCFFVWSIVFSIEYFVVSFVLSNTFTSRMVLILFIFADLSYQLVLFDWVLISKICIYIFFVCNWSLHIYFISVESFTISTMTKLIIDSISEYLNIFLSLQFFYHDQILFKQMINHIFSIFKCQKVTDIGYLHRRLTNIHHNWKFFEFFCFVRFWEKLLHSVSLHVSLLHISFFNLCWLFITVKILLLIRAPDKWWIICVVLFNAICIKGYFVDDSWKGFLYVINRLICHVLLWGLWENVVIWLPFLCFWRNFTLVIITGI